MKAHDTDAPADEKNGAPGLRKFTGHTGQRSADLGSTIHFGIFALMLAVTLPPLLRSFCPTWNPVDTSWGWMLGYSLQHHLQWGRSIVWTYGPFGFLTHPFFYSDHLLWGLAATVRLISWFAFGLGFACILRRIAPDDRPFARTTVPVALGWSIGASFLHLSTQSAIVGLLLLALAMGEEERAAAGVELALAGALLALGAMVKSTALIVSLFALLAYPALWWYAGRGKSTRRSPLIPLLSFSISFCALWALSAQSFSDLGAYLRGTWALVSGYTPAMSATGLELQIVWALLILALFATTAAGFLARGRKTRVAQCLLLGGLAFWAWKEGFTDQDRGYFLHPMTFYGTALLIASVGTVMVSGERSRHATIGAYGAYAIALLCLLHAFPIWRPLPTYASVLANYEDYASLISSGSRRVAEQHEQTLAIQAHFRVKDGVLKAVGTASVNMIPWSLMMAQGYHLRLIASPVLQSYSVYTPYLDSLNARQIWDGDSAEKVIYTFQDLDHRYPLFDEPATFRALLTCYRTEYASGRYAVLNRIGCSPHELGAADPPREGAFGRWTAVPPQATYAAIGVSTTVVGHLENILYKAAYVRILFRLSDGSVKGPYRFIYPVAGDGFFVRYFVGSQSDAARLFSGNASGLRRITAIKLVTRGSSDYAKRFEIQFFDGKPAAALSSSASNLPRRPLDAPHTDWAAGSK